MNHEPKKSDLVGDLDFFLYYKSDLVGDLEHYINLFSIFWATIIPYHPNRRSKIFFFRGVARNHPSKMAVRLFGPGSWDPWSIVYPGKWQWEYVQGIYHGISWDRTSAIALLDFFGVCYGNWMKMDENGWTWTIELGDLPIENGDLSIVMLKQPERRIRV